MTKSAPGVGLETGSPGGVLFGVLGVLMMASRYGNLSGGLALMIVALVGAMLFRAIAAGLELLVSIDANTRATRDYLERLSQRSDDSQPKRSSGMQSLPKRKG